MDMGTAHTATRALLAQAHGNLIVSVEQNGQSESRTKTHTRMNEWTYLEHQPEGRRRVRCSAEALGDR